MSEDLDLKEITIKFRSEYKPEDLDSGGAQTQDLPGPSIASVEVDGVSYIQGDFVYLISDPPFDTKINYLIGQVKALWKDGEGVGVRINVFFRPWQVKYKSSQKYVQKRGNFTVILLNYTFILNSC